MSVKVYLVDDHRLFLSGVKAELSDAFDVVGSAHDVDTAIEEIRGLEPDVVLVDVHMPDGGGIAVVCGYGREDLPSVLGDRACVGMVGGKPGMGRDRRWSRVRSSRAGGGCRTY